MDPKVSIVVLNHNHPEVVEVCLRTLQITKGVTYEVVVVDNGSEPDVVATLEQLQDKGMITTLVAESVNHFFSEGNNIGVRHSDPASKYILLLNSDVAFLRDDWLVKAISWMEGTAVFWPSVWGLKPTVPKSGPLDIVSVGWSHDASVLPSNARPEGWCCLIRREIWRELSPDLPWHGGFEEAIATSVRAGARCGVLSQYGSYLVHREQGSGSTASAAVNTRTPDIAGWFAGLEIETLDFTLGPDEHSSYIEW